MQTTVSDKTTQLTSAHASIANLHLNLARLEEALERSKARERVLTKDLQDEKALLECVAADHDDYVGGVKIWTELLADVAGRLMAQLSAMGRHNFSYSSNAGTSPNARLTLFFDGMIDVVEQLHSGKAARLANESHKLCWVVLLKVLTKVVHKNPSINLTNVLERLPKDVDLKALEELVMPIIDKVNQVKRVEGQCMD
ncbi:hypothetical protein ZWY2020_052435 [Hordeum vulgare]|nr:hypothetical protein ZWY2020_052435 [Hordeum vulgare]